MEINKNFVLGIDIGTGSCKAVSVSQTGDALFQTNHFYSIEAPKPGYAVQNPQDIWQAFLSCCADISKHLSSPQAISLSSAMHSIMGVDKSGQPVTPLITWADKRSMEIAKKLRHLHGKSLYEATGTPIHSMTPVCKLIWFKENEPLNVYKWIGIKEFIWFQLFGVYEVDESIASATGLFNIHDFCWHPQALELCGIKADALSKVVQTNFSRKLSKDAATKLKVPENTQIFIGASDGCLANMGSFALSKESGALTIGTSAAVREASPKPVFDFPSMVFSYILERNTFICGGPMNNGGVIVPWLFKTFLNIPDPKDEDFTRLFETINTVPAGSEGLLFIPYLLGERAPVWDEKATGSYHHIRYTHTSGHFLRAAIEGVAYALNEIIQTLEKQLHAVKYISISGGFVQQPVWVQILANVTQKELRLYQTEDASCMGAAFLAMKEIDGSIPAPHNDYTSYKPNEEHSGVYKQGMDLFKKYSHSY